MKHVFKAIVLSGSMLFSFGLHAATFSPTTAVQLQADLTTAQTNGEDDTINLSGTYNVSDVGTGFSFASGESNALTITGADSSSTILNGNGSDRVLTLSSSGNVSVSGITIQNGLMASSSGGGLLATAVDISIQNCAFTSNAVGGSGGGGGASLTSSGSVIFSNNTMSGNSTTGTGAAGALAVMVNNSFTGEGNTFSNNTSTGQVGACFISTLGGDAVFNNNTLNSNSAVGQVGGCNIISLGNITANGNTATQNRSTGAGMGFASFQATSDMNFNNNTITGNSAEEYGAFYMTIGGNASLSGNTISENTLTDPTGEYAGIQVDSSGNIVFSNNTVNGNSGSQLYGGARLETASGTATVDGNIFSANSVGISGSAGVSITAAAGLIFTDNQVLSNESLGGEAGADLSSSGDIQVINNLIVGNTAANNIAGINIFDSATGAPSTLSLINNTVTGNTVANANIGGIYVEATDSSVTINSYNNIFFGNSNNGTTGVGVDAFFDNSSGNLNIFNNDLGEVCFSSPASCDLASLGSDAANNLSEDPLFIASSTGNYRLQAGSNLIDAGLTTAPSLPSLDLVGNPRSFLSIPDIGAYEAVAEISASSTTLDFGSVSINDSSTLIVTLTNSGSYALNVTAFTLSDTTSFALVMNAGSDACVNTSFQLVSGDSCTFGIEFAPDAVQTFAESLTIASDAPANPAYVLNLAGIGAAPGGCALTAVGGAGSFWPYSGFALSLALCALWRRKI